MFRIDELDRQIIACLCRDGRASFREVGQAVGLSAPAVKRRVDRLVDEGVIKGFTAVMETGALGPSVEALVEIYCQGRTSAQALRRIASSHPEVRAAWTVSGDSDAVLHVQAATIGALEQLLERVRQDQSVDHTRSVIVLSTLFERTSSPAS